MLESPFWWEWLGEGCVYVVLMAGPLGFDGSPNSAGLPAATGEVESA